MVQLWDSLYHTIDRALYAEAARWGDYRRDVHQWQTRGQLYTVDGHYQTERSRLLDEYFPTRSDHVLADIVYFTGIDDFEAPDDWIPLTAAMFHEWDGTGSDAQPLDKYVNVDWNLGTTLGGGSAIAGFVNVDHNQFADLTPYGDMVLRGSGNGVRILANRLVPHGPWKQIIVNFNASDPYWDSDLQAIVFHLADLMTTTTNEGKQRVDDFVHLNALKVDWSSSARVNAIYLTPGKDTQHIAAITHDNRNDSRNTITHETRLYDLQGRRMKSSVFNTQSQILKKGIYIRDGKKVVKK